MELKEIKVGQRIRYPRADQLNQPPYDSTHEFGLIVRIIPKDEWAMTDREPGVDVYWDHDHKIDPVSISYIELEDEVT